MSDDPMNAYLEELYEEPTEQERLEKLGLSLSNQVLTIEDWWRKERADEVVRNMSYYRGQFWKGDGISGRSMEAFDYTAQRNEFFPIVDIMVASLALDLPQCEALDRRQISNVVPTRKTDPTFVGRRIAASINWMAEEDEFDTAVQELVLHAVLFDEGGTLKTTWSNELKRVVWRVKLPWEVHFDPRAKRLRDARWSCERFVLHWDDFKSRVKSGVYNRPRGPVRPDTYPRELVDQFMTDEAEVRLREMGLREDVSLVEWYDYRTGTFYHLHPDTRSVLLQARAPFGMPYEKLVFHSGVGRIRGVSDATVIAPGQRDINELVAARREIVARLPRRMLIDGALFPGDEEFDRWSKSKSWEPTRINPPQDGTIEGRIYVTPTMDTTFDFNEHLDQDIEHLRYLAGSADFQHGGVKNIRTAEEAEMVKNAVSGRMDVRTRRVTRMVKNGFRTGLRALQWALRNQKASGADAEYLRLGSEVDVSTEQYVHEVLNEAFKFQILPFSPLMEDRNARREHLIKLLTAFATGEAAKHIEWREMVREAQELFGLRPSIVKEQPPEEEPPEEAPGDPALAAPPGGMPMVPPLAAPPALGGADPAAALGALLGGGGAPGAGAGANPLAGLAQLAQLAGPGGGLGALGG